MYKLATMSEKDAKEAAAILYLALWECVTDLQWASAASDFSPEGEAHEGWKHGPVKSMQQAYQAMELLDYGQRG